MKRALHIGDKVCISEESLAAVRRDYAAVNPHVEYEITEATCMNGRRLFELCWVDLNGEGEFIAQAWPSEVHLSDGAEERLHARQVKFHAELKAEVAAARDARAKRCPKKKTVKRKKGKN